MRNRARLNRAFQLTGLFLIVSFIKRYPSVSEGPLCSPMMENPPVSHQQIYDILANTYEHFMNRGDFLLPAFTFLSPHDHILYTLSTHFFAILCNVLRINPFQTNSFSYAGACDAHQHSFPFSYLHCTPPPNRVQ